MQNRREFLKSMAAAGAAVLAVSAVDVFAAAADPWSEVPRILARIKPPTFPKRDFEITKFGARGDSSTDNTEAFAKAIAACNKAGGGRVVVPKGEFLTGAIHLKSNVNLFVGDGATI